MRPLVLTLRTDPDERLDLSALVPHRLTDKTAAEIGKHLGLGADELVQRLREASEATEGEEPGSEEVA